MTTRLARTCHALLAAVVLAALVVQLVLTVVGGAPGDTGAGDPTVGLGTRLVRLLSYFTIESNLLVLAASVTLALRPDRDGRGWRVVRLDALLGIVITGIVFVTVLAPQVHPVGAAWWANAGLHYVSPVLTLLFWLAFGPRPRIGWRTVAWAFAWPVLWIAYTFVHGALTGWYPYPFLDAGAVGYGPALTSTAGVVVLAAVLAVVFRFLDARLPTLVRPASGDSPARG